jgi:hypothetical protein
MYHRQKVLKRGKVLSMVPSVEMAFQTVNNIIYCLFNPALQKLNIQIGLVIQVVQY